MPPTIWISIVGAEGYLGFVLVDTSAVDVQHIHISPDQVPAEYLEAFKALPRLTFLTKADMEAALGPTVKGSLNEFVVGG